MWHMGDGWGWWMVMGWVWMVAFWGLIIWAVYSLITRLGADRAPREPQREPSAIEILERRYARGEIDTEQFEVMRARLTAAGSASPATGDAVAAR